MAGERLSRFSKAHDDLSARQVRSTFLLAFLIWNKRLITISLLASFSQGRSFFTLNLNRGESGKIYLLGRFSAFPSS